jgi:hypothetical protein
MHDDLQLVKKTEGTCVRHAFLMPPPPAPVETVDLSPSFSFRLQQQIGVLLLLHSPHFPYERSAFRVMLQTIEYCFRKAGYGHGQLSTPRNEGGR